jgi:hypothetical protein
VLDMSSPPVFSGLCVTRSVVVCNLKKGEHDIQNIRLVRME